MKKVLGIAFAALLVFAVATPALALVDVTAVIFKDKDKHVEEFIVKDKLITIVVVQVQELEGVAEAEALANQINVLNTVDAAEGSGPLVGRDDIDPDDLGFGIKRDALIQDSVDDNTGIIGVNQDVGNMVNQGNAVSFALTTSESSFTNSQVEADQINALNFVRHNEFLKPDGNDGFIPDLTATILNSINNNTGIIGVNQNSGNMNNQLNAVALAVGVGAQKALSEAALGQVNALNVVEEIETVKVDLIEGSVNGNTGMIGVNQSSGNMNNQASAFSVSALTSTVSIDTPGGP